MSSETIGCDALGRFIEGERDYALVDIREPVEYNASHIPGATSLPRRDIEFRIATLVPVRSTPIVVVGDSDKRARLAVGALRSLGYERASELDGGIAAWTGAGGTAVFGVNVPSKAFGETVRAAEQVPEIGADELCRRINGGERILILDARTPEEYARSCIPGGFNVPGGDLILRAADLKHEPEQNVIVNCAGRTRSIIGVQTLRRLGVDNVFALKNGTMGWLLAGLELEQRPRRTVPPPSQMSRADAEAQAAGLARAEGIRLLSSAEFEELSGQQERVTLYRVDVRSAAEYRAGHIPGFLSVSGGQAIQRADDFIAVRSGTVVFACDGSARSVMTAYWYRRMGFEHVYALAGGTRAWTERGLRLEAGEAARPALGLEQARDRIRFIASEELASQMARGTSPAVLDVSLSLEYAAGHLPGAQWISRGWLEPKIPSFFPDRDAPLVVTCRNGEQSTLAASTLAELGYGKVSVLRDGVKSWCEEGKPLDAGMTRSLVETEDVVLSAAASGDKQAMQKYLDWEIALARK